MSEPTAMARELPEYTEDQLIKKEMDFLDRKADAWMLETDIVAATHGMVAVFAKWAPRELLERFRSQVEAHFHLCFVEGAWRAWEEIARQGGLVRVVKADNDAPTPDALTEARRLGFDEGLEASAKVADGYGDRSTTPGDQTVWHAIGKVIGQDIRALKPGE